MLFRALIVLLLASHVFFMYGAARTMRETFGFDAATTVIALIFAAFMLLPFVWAVALADLPQIITGHREQRRFARGECPACGYQLSHSQSITCSECGAQRRPPAAYAMTWATVRRYLLLNAAALILGVSTCESCLLLDESRFKSEIRVRGLDAPGADGNYVRARIAPFETASMHFDTALGYSAND